MNVFKINGKYYKYESFWRNLKSEPEYDSMNILLPYPKEHKKWSNQELFLSKLKSSQNGIKDKFIKYDSKKSCLLCGKKNITTGVYTLNNIRWEDGLFHYIKEHNIKPSEKFIDSIFLHEINPKIISVKRSVKVKGQLIVKNSMKYLKLSRNQILIMDALMEHGGKKQYIDKKNNKLFRYSEHAGLLDFNNKGLDRVIVYGDSNRVETNDSDIYFPGEMIDAFDYEYIFHTHPPTPKPGGRANIGIIQEFPSISDIFHFIEHYNNGETQGSIVIAPEGMYIIRKYKQDNKLINSDIDQLYRVLKKLYNTVYRKSSDKYGVDFTTEEFYSVIAQDLSYIQEINETLNKFDLHIDYYSRIKDKSNKWVIDTVYIPIYVVEPVNIN